MKPGTFCPLLQKACVEHKCAWYIQMAGTNKNTGEAVNDFGCAIAWLPILLVENATESRQTAAAVESLRNATILGSDATRAAMMTGIAGMALKIEDNSQ